MGIQKNLIFEDVKPLCYFFALPFFYLTIDKATIEEITKVIKVASIGISISFIILFGAYQFRRITFSRFL